MIEGNPKMQGYLDKSNFPYAISLVGNETKMMKFHVHKSFPTGGSVFREVDYSAFPKEDIIEQQLGMDTIDNIVAKRGIGDVDFLKIDVQGSEFPAILGARKTLRDTHIVLLEASLHQNNQDAVLFTDINLLLQSYGFRMYDIADLRHSIKAFRDSTTGKRSTLTQMDIIWAKEDSPLFTKTIFPPPSPPRHTWQLKN